VAVAARHAHGFEWLCLGMATGEPRMELFG
jgi:hypothetical protein